MDPSIKAEAVTGFVLFWRGSSRSALATIMNIVWQKSMETHRRLNLRLRPQDFTEHCYLNNTSTDQSAKGSFRIPVLLRCVPAVAADKAATGESWISDAVCLRRMVR